MSRNRFELFTDIIITYEVNHDNTSDAIMNEEANGHPKANEIIDEEIRNAYANIKKRVEELEGVSGVDWEYFGFDGEATG